VQKEVTEGSTKNTSPRPALLVRISGSKAKDRPIERGLIMKALDDIFAENLIQYRHNNSTPGYVVGYDLTIRAEIEDVITDLEIQVSNQAEIIRDFQWRLCQALGVEEIPE